MLNTNNNDIYHSHNIIKLRQNFINNADRKLHPSVKFSNHPVATNIEKLKKLEKKSPDKKNSVLNDLAHATGVAATLGQVAAGVCLMGAAIKSGKPNPFNLFKLFKNKKAVKKPVKDKTSELLKKIASKSLAASYLVSVPSCIGASIKAKQPSIFLTSMLWGAASPIMAKSNLPARTVGFLDLSYVPSFAGFANKIHNKKAEKSGEEPRKMKIDFNIPKMAKFVIDDQKRAIKSTGKTIKQVFNFATGKRKEKPDIVSLKPTKESMSMASTLTMAGALPKVIMGKKLGKFTKYTDLLLGAGMIFDSIGMMSLGATHDDSRRLPLLIGSPMRVLGDFFHSNKFMYGLRTLGGASFEYYFAAMNKENHDKPKLSDKNINA